VLKERLTGEVLIVGVFDPPGDDGLVRQLEGMLEIHEPGHQARRRCRATLVRREEGRPFAFEKLPIDQPRELHQFVAGIDHIDQPGAEQVILFRGAGMGLHRRPEFAGFLHKAYETMQFKANKTEASAGKINVVEVIQAGLSKLTYKYR
jgi:hypothetical protein